MEEEFAEYLVTASKKLLLEYGQTADQNDVKKLQDLVMVRLHAQYLNNLGDLQYCDSLKICDLSGNFLKNIDSLEGCTNLIKLDLHNNQIEELPGGMFWGNMKCLCLLYLHDNGISTLDNVYSLSFCPNLIALTLLNTPLSLKIAYRHIVVNSIFSLKALDYYVISDEEIMEDWRLPEKFKPFTPMLFVDYRPLPPKERTFQEEINVVRNIISKINQILSHYSPVLIIQKWIRGYLIRKILCIIPVRKVLKHKHFITQRTMGIIDGLTDSTCERISSRYHFVKPEETTEIKKVITGIQLIDMKDTQELHLYLRSLRMPLVSAVLKLEEKIKMNQKESKRSPRKEFLLLLLDNFDDLKKSGLSLEVLSLSARLHFYWQTADNVLLDLKKTEIKEEDEMATEFRLSGYRMPFYSVSKELQKYANRERIFIDDVHDQLRYIMHPVPQTMPVHVPVCIEKRIFAKAFGTIRLRPLHAIDKAYWESQRCDIQRNKERAIMRMLIAEAAAEDYNSRLLKEKKVNCHRRYEEDKLMVNDGIRENQRKRDMDLVNNRKKFAQFLENKESKVSERTFGHVFNTQHNSLTRGLLQLDGWRKREETIIKRKSIIKENVQEQKYRKDVFKNYRDQRIRMLQKRNASEKMYRKTVTDEMVKERFEQSKARAKAVKTPRLKIECMLPVIGSSGTARPVEDYYS